MPEIVVGTLDSLHEANMDIALDKMELNLYDENPDNRIYTEDVYSVPQYIGKQGKITRSIANQGAIILGDVDSCVISSGALIESRAKLTRCVVMERHGHLLFLKGKDDHAFPFTIINIDKFDIFVFKDVILANSFLGERILINDEIEASN